MRMFLFSLLLLLTPVDDAVAWSTPEGNDDVVAAANNHCLKQRRASQTEQVQSEAAQPFTLISHAVLPCLPVSPSCPRTERGSARAGTLYAFMSLRC
jgi:hypothetical protein